MGATDPSHVSVGDFATANYINNLGDWVGVPVQTPTALAVALTGTNGPQAIVQGGAVLTTTDSNGQAGISFPTSFPNSLLSIQVSLMDASTGVAVKVVGGTYGVSSFTAKVYLANGAVAASISVRIAYIAVGT